MTSPDDNQESWFFKFCGWFLFAAIVGLPIIGGPIAIYFGGSGVIAGVGTNSWERTSGVIIRSEAFGERSRSSGTGNSSSTTVYRWNLKYSYMVDQNRYEGTQYDLAHTPSFRSSSFRDLAKEYRAGGSVNVYYDPDNPKAALLKTGPTVWSVVWLAAGLVLTGGVLLIAGRALIDRIRQSSDAA